MSVDDDNPHAIDERDIKALQDIKRANERNGPEPGTPFPDTDGDDGYQRHREPGLPSDLACADCGGVIEHGEACIAKRHYATERTVNEYGEALAGGHDAVYCLGCGDGR